MSPMDHTVGTSGLGNSLDSAWDPNDMTGSWSSHIEPPANFRPASSFNHSNNHNISNKNNTNNSDRLEQNGEDKYHSIVNNNPDLNDNTVIMPRISGGYSLYQKGDPRILPDFDA